jgi:protein involved in temperature-dependent protein secretion
MESNILNASAQPDDDLVREVYANFGLCMYFAQVFETGLIIILTTLEAMAKKAATRQEYEQSFDSLYARHEALTFGNLLRALSSHKFLPVEIMEEARALKAERDHLAHRFFRDHDLDALTVGGSFAMIQDLEARRVRFMELDQRVSDLVDKVYEKAGIDAARMKKMTQGFMAEMLDEARSRYSSPV